MDRNLETEIDGIKQELQQLKELLVKDAVKNPIHLMMEGMPKEAMPSAFQNESIKEIIMEIETKTNERQDTGAVSYVGSYASADRQSIWAEHALSTNDLLRLTENQHMEKVLSSIGNKQRLEILIALLKKPMTVTQLIEELNLNTTGQAYHHLKPLIAADIVCEDAMAERGTYIVKPHRVQGIFMLLTGVRDLLDSKYSSGTWEEPAQH